MSDLAAMLAEELAQPAPPAVAAMAADLARETPHAMAVLFYGSALRTGDLSGVLDFYVLTEREPRRGLKGLVNRILAPEVSYREAGEGAEALRAKIATLTLRQFLISAHGRRADTTIWTRFAQPAALIWSRDAEAARSAVGAVALCVATASRFAAALGPPQGLREEYWAALFQRTYKAELRVEAQGRGDTLIARHPARYVAILAPAWEEAGVPFEARGRQIGPMLSPRTALGLRWGWSLRQALGKPLNAARLIKAAFTFDGAARYAAWKIERHTGVDIELTPWRERHPILSAPGVLWRVARARRKG
jgi:hypothetical protein